MGLEENLSKRIKALKDMDKLVSLLVYYRDNRQYMEGKERVVIWRKGDHV